MKTLNVVFLILVSSTKVNAQDVKVVSPVKHEERKSEAVSHPNTAQNNDKAIDLGLSVKWANCNIGASVPEDSGEYYAWGETETKTSYSADNSYTYGKDKSWLIDNGYINAFGILTKEHDAANQKWGGLWRMPTQKEIQELAEKCKWKWTTQNNSKGYMITGPNGNSIFLPAAGNQYAATDGYKNISCYYWSSSTEMGNSFMASGLSCDANYRESNTHYRNSGRTIRAVLPK